MKALILNDTRRVAGHYGCVAGMKALHLLCEKYSIEVLKSFMDVNLYDNTEYLELLKKSDAVLVNGEGSMHDDQDQAVEIVKTASVAKDSGKKIFLINTVWQRNVILNRLLDVFDLIFVRERFSKKEINKAGSVAEVVPDLIFYDDIAMSETVKRKGMAVVDSINRQDAFNLLFFALKNRADFFYMGFDFAKRYKHKKYLFKLKRSRFGNINAIEDLEGLDFMVSGRFHAVCLAMKLGLPCGCVAANTHKIEGLISDIGLDRDEYMFLSSDMDSLSPDTVKESHMRDMDKIRYYVDSAQSRIERMFEDIVSYV